MQCAQDLKNLREVIAKLGKDVEVPAPPDAPSLVPAHQWCWTPPVAPLPIRNEGCCSACPAAVVAGAAAVHQRAQLGGRGHRGADAEVPGGAAAGLPDTPAGRGPGAAEQGRGALCDGRPPFRQAVTRPGHPRMPWHATTVLIGPPDGEWQDLKMAHGALRVLWNLLGRGLLTVVVPGFRAQRKWEKALRSCKKHLADSTAILQEPEGCASGLGSRQGACWELMGFPNQRGLLLRGGWYAWVDPRRWCWSSPWTTPPAARRRTR